MSAGTVVVRGHAVVPGEPDEVHLALSVTAVESRADAALAEAARLSEELFSLLSELDVPRQSRSTAGVSVQEEWERREGELIHRGYRASNRIVVRLEAFDTIGRLMNAAVARAKARVEGPWWRIRLENPARVEACRQAVSDARRKAEAYATALGMRLGAVVSVIEPGTDQPRSEAPRPRMMAAGAAPEVPVEPGQLDVPATVDVTFALEL